MRRSAYIILGFLFLIMAPHEAIRGQVADTPWPTVGQNIKHTGFSPYTGPESDSLLWTYTVTSPIVGSPVVGNQYIFLASSDTVYALEKKSGHLSWKYATPETDTIQSGMTLSAAGTLFFGSEEGVVYALNTGNQTLKWKFETEGAVTATPNIGSDGNVFIGSEDSTLYAVDALRGTKDWKYKAGTRIRSAPALGTNGNLILATGHKVYSFDTDKGQLEWTFDVKNSIPPLFPTVVDSSGTVYVSMPNDGLYAINNQGNLKWKYTKLELNSSPSLGPEGTVFITSNQTIALDSADGSKKWEADQELLYSTTIDAEGTLYGGTKEGEVFAITQKRGQIWKFNTKNPVLYSPVLDENGILYVAESGPLPVPADKKSKKSGANVDSNYRVYAIGNSEEVSIADNVNTPPEKIHIKQNYPNPFNPSTTIKFSLPQASNVQLTVYNAIGQKVTTLINRPMNPGSHSVSFEASGLSSGVYIYRLEANGFSQAKKMLLIK